MRRALTTALVAVLTLTGASAVMAQAAPSAKGPEHKLTTNPERLDLGWILPSTKKPGTITLTNTSDEVVELIRVTSSCTCTVGELREDQKVLQPGDSTELTITLKGGVNTGPMVQRAYVHYKGSRAPFEVIVAADVSLPVKTDPTFVNLLGTSKVGKVKLESLDGMPFRVTSVDGREPTVFDLDGKEIDASKAGMAFLVEFDYTGIADTDLDRWFMIETDHPEALELPLRVLHTSLYQVSADKRRPTWTLGDDRFILGRMQAGDEVIKDVVLKKVVSVDDVTGVSVLNTKGLDAEILSKRVDGQTVVLQVRFVATGGEMGLIKARLSVSAKDQSQEADVIARVEAAS